MTAPPLDYTAFDTWLTIGLLIALLAIPGWLLLRGASGSAVRQTVRLVLHGLLVLAVVGLWRQPRWQTQLPAGRVLLVADDVPGPAAQQVRERMQLREVVRASAFRGATDTVVLLGQSFSDALLARLARQVVSWIPYEAPNQLQFVGWQGVVRRGSNQTVSGQLSAPEGGLLRLRFGQQGLDSTRIKGDNQPFRLSYPVFSEGRTSLTLWLDNILLDTIRFVARPLPRLRVRFVLDAPDFETRTLATWLGKQGHRVELANTLSKGIGTSTSINAPTAAATLPDLLITDPANLSNPLVGKALAASKAVLVLNLTKPDADIPTINRALATRWQVRRVPGKDTLRVGPSLTALPYRFVASVGSMPLHPYPAVAQPTTARGGTSRVAVSLLLESFPLRLSGDSLAYDRLWLSVLAPLQPTSTNNLGFEAPLLRGQPAWITLTNPVAIPGTLRLGPDTVALRPTPINARSWVGLIRPSAAGWQALQDTLAGYVYGTNTPQGNQGAVAAQLARNKLAAMVRLHRRHDVHRPSTARYVETPIPDWLWFTLIAVLLTALWLEPKLG